MNITKTTITDALKNVMDPDLGVNIVDLGFVKNIVISGSSVSLEIQLTTPACPVKEEMQKQAYALLMNIDGVLKVDVQMTAQVQGMQREEDKDSNLKDVKNIVAISSGKGGVGKSTIAVNLALAFSLQGASVGLLDADIYGPSIPKMVGYEGGAEIKNKLIQPCIAHSLKFMSMGLFAQGEQALIWRGPMAHKALHQSLYDVKWGELDYLFVDLPPGTGDVHLTLAQSGVLAGAVVVATPQDIGFMISLKTYQMFSQTKVHVFGLIENMSYYVCSNCNHKEYIFGSKELRQESEKRNIPFLGGIPIHPDISSMSNQGTPIMIANPQHPISKIYQNISKGLAALISKRNLFKKTVSNDK